MANPALNTLNVAASIPLKVWLFIIAGLLVLYVLYKAAFAKGGLSAVGVASGRIGESVGTISTGTADVAGVIAAGVAPWRATDETFTENPLLNPFYEFGRTVGFKVSGWFMD